MVEVEVAARPPAPTDPTLHDRTVVVVVEVEVEVVVVVDTEPMDIIRRGLLHPVTSCSCTVGDRRLVGPSSCVQLYLVWFFVSFHWFLLT